MDARDERCRGTWLKIKRGGGRLEGGKYMRSSGRSREGKREKQLKEQDIQHILTSVNTDIE